MVAMIQCICTYIYIYRYIYVYIYNHICIVCIYIYISVYIYIYTVSYIHIQYIIYICNICTHLDLLLEYCKHRKYGFYPRAMPKPLTHSSFGHPTRRADCTRVCLFWHLLAAPAAGISWESQHL